MNNPRVSDELLSAMNTPPISEDHLSYFTDCVLDLRDARAQLATLERRSAELEALLERYAYQDELGEQTDNDLYRESRAALATQPREGGGGQRGGVEGHARRTVSSDEPVSPAVVPTDRSDVIGRHEPESSPASSPAQTTPARRDGHSRLVWDKAKRKVVVQTTPAPESWPSAKSVDELLDSAWGIIANASGGDWEKGDALSPGWRVAAICWRDRYHEWLDDRRQPPHDPETPRAVPHPWPVGTEDKRGFVAQTPTEPETPR